MMEFKKEFKDKLKEVSRNEGWRDSETLSKFLSSATRAIRGEVLRAIGDQEAFSKNEEAYMLIAKSCKNPKTMQLFAEMMATVQLALETDSRDFFSDIFQELLANTYGGQFFTPWDISLLTAKTIIENPKKTLAEANEQGCGFLMLHEPAVGVGTMVLAANQVLREEGIDIEKEVFWECWDIDWNAVCATFLQLSFTNTPAIIVHGNTLKQEVFDKLITPALILNPKGLTS